MLQAMARLTSASKLIERYRDLMEGAEVDWRATLNVNPRFRVFWRSQHDDRRLCKLL